MEYRTLGKESEGEYKEKGSKFLAYAFPVDSEEKFKSRLQDLRIMHHQARHHCYAWTLGVEQQRFRANDDGEPSGTAGKPILGQLDSFELNNSAIVVVRYFGGTKLGTGGLIHAYREAARASILENRIEIKEVRNYYRVRFPYEQTSVLTQLEGKGIFTKTSESYGTHCEWIISAKDSLKDFLINELELQPGISSIFLGRY